MTKLLKYFGWLLFVLYASTSISCDAQKQALYGSLQVKNAHLSDMTGKPVVLRGISYGWSNEWGAYYNKYTVNKLATQWHATILRASMGVSAKNCYLKNPEYAIDCVSKVVDQAIKEGIYVIIDFHSHELLTKDACGFFSMISKKYGKYPNVLYEIFNEPVNQSWTDVKEYAETVIDTIRKYDSNNIILVGSPHWDQDIHLAAANPILHRNNIMYTLHFYAATHKQWLRDRTDAAMAKGIPVFVSECAGMEATGDGYLDVNEWNRWVNWMEKNKLSWTCWSLTPKVETCSMLVPKAPTNGKWAMDHIKPWGKIVKENLQRLSEK